MADRPKLPAEFDNFAEDYQELLRDPLRDRFTSDGTFFFDRKIQVIREFLGTLAMDMRKLNWLDVGCGRGDLLRAGRDFFQSASGCDPSQRMLSSCAGFEVRHQADPDRLPFEDSSFDFITAVCVYHHVPRERRLPLTLEIKRLLKPSGVMCIIEHNPLNPVTRLIVSRTPVDADAHLLRLREAGELLSSAQVRIRGARYFLLFPRRFYHRFAALEGWLSAIPLGGQYSLFAQK